MPFGLPVRNQAPAATAPQVDPAVPQADTSARRLAGALRPSQVPVQAEATQLNRIPRTGGGTAVQRARQGRPSGTPTRSSTASAHPVKDVLRAPGEPLTGPVREDMEARLGAGLSDVRIHTDSAAHRAAQAVSARAFTAGSHIAFQRGQYDPASTAGRQTLAHELTHVIQQRSGPVAGTDTGDGLRVSDPADRFERAAEATAQRAMAGGVRSAATAALSTGGAAGAVTPAEGETVPVQRKVGFEFELVNKQSTVHTVTTENGKESKNLKKDSKAALKYLNQGGGFSDNHDDSRAYLAADNGNVEYVTDPLTDRDQVKTAVGAIVNFHQQSQGKARRERIPTAEDGATYEVKINAGPPNGRPQATIGVGLHSIRALFEELNKWNALEIEPPTRKKAKTEQSARSQRATLRKRVAEEASANTALAAERAQLILDTLPPAPGQRQSGGPSNKRRAAPPVIERSKAFGFISIILKTAYDVGAARLEIDDPKYYLPLMPRTDFVSMLDSMNRRTQAWLKQDLIWAIGRVQGNSYLNESLLWQYKDEKGNKYQGRKFTRRAWLESILKGSKNDKDKLSPPPGYESHKSRVNRRKRPEGIGAMGRDGGLSLFEFRGFTAPGVHLEAMPADEWLPLALVVCDLVAKVTGDAGFAPAADEIDSASEAEESAPEAEEGSKEEEADASSAEEAEEKPKQVVTRSGLRKRTRT